MAKLFSRFLTEQKTSQGLWVATRSHNKGELSIGMELRVKLHHESASRNRHKLLLLDQQTQAAFNSQHSRHGVSGLGHASHGTLLRAAVDYVGPVPELISTGTRWSSSDDSGGTPTTVEVVQETPRGEVQASVKQSSKKKDNAPAKARQGRLSLVHETQMLTSSPKHSSLSDSPITYYWSPAHDLSSAVLHWETRRDFREDGLNRYLNRHGSPEWGYMDQAPALALAEKPSLPPLPLASLTMIHPKAVKDPQLKRNCCFAALRSVFRCFTRYCGCTRLTCCVGLRLERAPCCRHRRCCQGRGLSAYQYYNDWLYRVGLEPSLDRHHVRDLSTVTGRVVVPPTGLYLGHFSPLGLAVRFRNTSLVDLLLKKKANPVLVDGTGISPYLRALRAHSDALHQQLVLLVCGLYCSCP